MTLAADTREAVDARPFLREALRAGVVNYSAAARFLDVGDEEAVAAALGRYADDLPPYDPDSRSVRVTMESGLGPVDDGEGEATLRVGGAGFEPGAGSLTAVLATGGVDAAALREVLGRLAAAGVAVRGAGVAGDALLVVVDRRDGPDAIRTVEDAMESVPDPTG